MLHQIPRNRGNQKGFTSIPELGHTSSRAQRTTDPNFMRVDVVTWIRLFISDVVAHRDKKPPDATDEQLFVTQFLKDYRSNAL
jgi:hypothetical protein